METRFDEEPIPGALPPPWALEVSVPTKPHPPGCEFDSRPVELEPHPQWNLPLGWPGATCLGFLFLLLLEPAQESGMGRE